MVEAEYQNWLRKMASAYLKEYRAQILAKVMVTKAIDNYDLEFLNVSFDVLELQEKLIYRTI